VSSGAAPTVRYSVDEMPSHGFIPSSQEELLRRRVKLELRKRLRGLRATMPAASCAERSARVVGRLLELEPLARARTVALFWPMTERREVDLRPLDAQLRARGARVAYPLVERADAVDGASSSAMSFRFVGDPSTLADAGGGFLEPSPGDPVAAPGELEVIVVPALAVDPRGHRIGYGAGYYDRTLPAYAPPAVTVAVAFDFQLVPEVPATEGDVPVDWAVTDLRELKADRSP
jgi:5-formyltetrahydrofolate cyclo-ligase